MHALHSLRRAGLPSMHAAMSSNTDTEDSVWPMRAGAISGAAACITSMPCDCVKTRIEMSLPRSHKPPGMITSILAFLRMGRSMVKHGGLGSLYIGILPRLCDKVCGCQA